MAKGALYFRFLSDAEFQGLVYWIMGAVSDDLFTHARLTGFYKHI
jgi:hypothetical protein